MSPINKEEIVSSETSVQPGTEEELDYIPDFVQPLFDLVTSSGDEVRAWPWMGGTEASLRASIYTHPRAQRYLTPEDIPVMMSEILQTLAQRLETDELEEQKDSEKELQEQQLVQEEETQPEEVNKAKENIQKEVAPVQPEEDEPLENIAQVQATNQKNDIQAQANEIQKNLEIVNTRQPKKEATEKEQQKTQPTTKAEAPAELPAKEVVAATPETITKSEPASTPVTIEPEQPANGATETEAAEAPSSGSADTVRAGEPSEREVPTTIDINDIDSVSEDAEQAPVVEETDQAFIPAISMAESPVSEERIEVEQEVETEQQGSAFETQDINTTTTTNSVLKNSFTEYEPQLVEGEAEVSPLHITEEIFAQSETAESPYLGAEDIVATNNIEELDEDEEIEATEVSEVVVTEFQSGGDSVDGFIDEEDLPFEDSLDTIDEQLNLGEDDEPTFSGHIEVADVDLEQKVQVSVPIAEIEESLTQLIEHFEESEPEIVEAIDEVLDKIVEVSARIETDTENNIDVESEVQEELEELFIKLFDELGIEHTPELIESLARLTIRYHLTNEAERFKEEEVDALPQDSGTHEAIAQILVGLNTIDETMEHAYVIGKSALRLYRFKLAMA